MSDIALLNAIAIGVAMIAYGVFVLYGAGFARHRWLEELRRITVWIAPQWPWPASTAIWGVLPFGAAALIGMTGRYVAGETITLRDFPGNIGQNMMVLACVLVGLAFWFMLRPPAWILPAWYRDAQARRRLGLDPDMPKPRGGSELVMTRNQYNFISVALMVFIAGVHVFDLPLRWAGTAFMTLALIGAYRIRGGTEPRRSARPAVSDRDWESWLARLDDGVTRRAGEHYLTHETALKALAWIEHSGSPVLGLEGFWLTETETRPSMAHIADFSELAAGTDGPARSVEAAREVLNTWRVQIDAVVVDIGFG